MSYRPRALLEPTDPLGRELRRIILKAAGNAGRGHIGPALSILEIIRCLYDSILIHDPKNPSLENRDIFILSKGHGALGLYAVLANSGYFDVSELETFCKFNSRLGGHPEWHNLPGIEFSTGSLGHGLAVAVGIAVAITNKQQNGRRVYSLVGDGELAEGSIWESSLHAAKHNLDNLCMIVDFNNMQANGPLDKVLEINDIPHKLTSFGFKVIEINGHSINEIKSALDFKPGGGKPLAIIAHTIKGKGIRIAENSPEWHHKAKITEDEVTLLLESMY
jgi:transketolase